jgi:hypothetical protein
MKQPTTGALEEPQLQLRKRPVSRQHKNIISVIVDSPFWRHLK